MGSIPTTAHAYTPKAIRHAITNGIKGIEHGNFLDIETAQLMFQKGVFLTPTLSCYEIMTRPPFEDFLPESGKVKNKEVMAAGLKALKTAADVGVTICYGSDLLVSMHALQVSDYLNESSRATWGKLNLTSSLFDIRRKSSPYELECCRMAKY
jgi:imidazolonepropionase-like amidohydrolase